MLLFEAKTKRWRHISHCLTARLETFFLDTLDVDPNALRVERSPSLALARGRVGAVVGGYELGKLAIRQSLVLGGPAVAAVFLLHFAHLS